MKAIILVEIALIGILSFLLWYASANLESTISFVTASILGFYSWNKITRSVIRKLQEVKAYSSETAVKPEDAGITWESLWLELVAEKTKDNRYYLKSSKR